MRRFKTGTPARVDRASINFSELEIQYGDSEITPFSFSSKPCDIDNSSVCYIAYTNSDTEAVIRNNLDRSPLYSGDIEGVGPRYCPSIEDKIVRFADKKRHLLFIEPCGKDTEELYLQGMSSSLPEEVQIKFYRTIKGLENVKIMRNAYAIEYDCIDPLALSYTLEIKEHSGLYGAGQFNGSSGYEEAAVQGFVAGVNAALKIQGKEPLVFSRTESYIGTLIDDLVTKGCSDPYRMMTSRSEYRLLLRQDNADERMMPIGRRLGLISDKDWNAFLLRKEQKEAEIERLKATTIAPSQSLNEYLVSVDTAPMTTGMRLAELIKRPQLSYDALAPWDSCRPSLTIDVREKIETEIKYEGYIARQKSAVEEMLRLEKSIASAKDQSKKAFDLIRYGTGMRNSFTYCWILTEYRKLGWSYDLSPYANSVLDRVESIYNEALDIVDNNELAAIAYVQLCKWKTAVNKYSDTYAARYTKMMCDNLCDYSTNWVVRTTYDFQE